MWFANKECADQPARLCRLISTFVIHLLEISYINLLHAEFHYLASLCSRRDWFESCLSETMKTGFLALWPSLLHSGNCNINMGVAKN